MNLHRIITAVVLSLFTAGYCFADTLVITYRSGKTQTVVLDEPSATVNSWQFVGGAAAVPQALLPATAPEKPKAEPVQPVKEENKFLGKSPEKKSNIHFKFNAPPIKD